METIPIPGAEIYYDKNFLSPEEATTLFNVLRTKCGLGTTLSFNGQHDNRRVAGADMRVPHVTSTCPGD